jgi:hypothetical protein
MYGNDDAILSSRFCFCCGPDPSFGNNLYSVVSPTISANSTITSTVCGVDARRYFEELLTPSESDK